MKKVFLLISLTMCLMAYLSPWKRCSICQEVIHCYERNVTRQKVVTPCGHNFHVGCIVTWLSSEPGREGSYGEEDEQELVFDYEIKRTCPVCRADLPLDELLKENKFRFLQVDSRINGRDLFSRAVAVFLSRPANRGSLQELVDSLSSGDVTLTSRQDFPENGQTWLHHCARRKEYGNVAYLLSRGLDRYAQDMNGDIALHEAVRGKSCKVLQLLLEWKYEEEERILRGRCTRKRKKRREEIGRQANGINVQNNAGQTPLSIAVQIGFVRGVQLLLEYGADECIADVNERLPLDFVQENGAQDIEQLLLNPPRHAHRLRKRDRNRK